ncbi:dihydrofolate reductase family protein [Hamadaea tsunoensis]|uniref:dihydrofolate reductase family protein n=1 Tax=Hamadaea tsunoensis TaxID=53368 RepID=UPI0004293588|nr:dihydrofolate reductase family protein [Hamadaea tsunoensis]
MGRIVISTNMSLDGVVQDPDGKEDFRHGGWFHQSGGADLAEWARHETDEALQAAALLVGRRSDAWFAQRWNDRSDVWADRLNTMPKYVVSTSLDDAAWTGATVLTGDAVTAVAKLKEQIDGDILVYASYRLAYTLLDNDLVDEIRLVVFPVVLGEGNRMFGPTADKKGLRLTDTRRLGEGLVLVTYETIPSA